MLSGEYRIDALNRRTVSKDGNGDMEGIIREFAESGLIPLTWLYGFMGVTASDNGLNIDPHLPEEYKYMGMDGFTYAKSRFKVTVKRDSETTFEVQKYAKKLPLNFVGERYKNAKMIISFNGKEIARIPLEDKGGKYFAAAYKLRKGCVITVKPEVK